jgi:glycosyltransferase involved in cell wall biosynthesis
MQNIVDDLVVRGGTDIRTSVVVPAYRAWSTLPLVLDALGAQLGQGREAILVVSGSREAPSLADRWPWLRVVVSEPRLLPGQARNVGAAHTQGELLAFLDADAVPGPRWLDRLEQALIPGVDAATGSTLNGTPKSRVGTAEYLLTFSETFARNPRPLRHAPSANLIIRRACFETLGGFREDLRAGEDTVMTFPIASQRRLALVPTAQVQHLNRTRLRPFLANQRLHGATIVTVHRLLPYPHRWALRGPMLLLAGPLRLLALARLVLYNPSHATEAVRAALPLAIGTTAWVLGASEASLRKPAGTAA